MSQHRAICEPHQSNLRGTAKLALDVSRQALEKPLRCRLEDGQGEDLAVQMQRDVSTKLLGEVLEDLQSCQGFVVSADWIGRGSLLEDVPKLWRKCSLGSNGL